MLNSTLYLVSKLSHYGVLSRLEVKNNASALNYLSRANYVQKVHRKKQVFYELTPQALPLLDEYRQFLLQLAKTYAQLHPRSVFYRSLLEELRFFDDKKKEAKQFLFLGDWQLQTPPSRYQLELAKNRYYEKNL